MSVVIKEVKNRRDLRRFVLFPEKLYKDNKYYVPPIVFNEMDTLDPKSNPASSFSDSSLYLAYKDGEIVGRVAAIVNRLANEQWQHNEVRFGWYDFIDDREVSAALMEKVYEFGRAHKMDSVVGPLGFTDFDPEGMLVEGYESLSTMALIYNHPYYKDHVEAMGFRKDVDWIEFKITIPEQLPDKFTRVSQMLMERSHYKIKHLTRSIIKKEGYAEKIFKIINETYKDLYNFTVLPQDLADKYVGFYLNLVDMRYISVIENEAGELVAFGIAMPSLARVLQKNRGKLFPFGWFPLVKSLFFKHDDGAELLLVGVKPEFRNSGVNSLIFADVYKNLNSLGVKWAETNAILETNTKNQSQFTLFEHEQKKRRRSYIKELEY